MRRIKAVLAAIVIMVVAMANGSVAQAAEEGLTVRAGELRVTELSAAELEALTGELTQEVIGGEISLPQATTASYTAYQYSQTFDFYDGDTWMAQADATCVVWHYTDGKVHLYQRTITVSRSSAYEASRSYGSIVNTDGSYSYTTGDRVYVFDDADTWTYAIDFYACPTEQHFSCYEV